jgi:4-hydroxybenzoyl-CoA thioesterase
MSLFKVSHTIYNGEAEAVSGHEVRAWVVTDKTHPSGIRATPIPDEIRARFD